MNFFVASVLLTSIASFLLAIFVYSRGKDKVLNRSLALFSLSLAVWTFAQAMAAILNSKGAIIFWTRIEVGAAVLLSPFFLHFIFSLLKKKSSKVLWLSYAIALIFIILDLTPLFVGDVGVLAGYRTYPKLSPVYALFAFWLVLSFTYGLVSLILAMRRATGDRYNKLLYVFVASLIGFLGGGTSFFLPFNINFPVISQFTLPIYVAVAVYSIVRHKLIDITVYVRKGLAYSIITVLFTALYVVLILLASNFFQARTQYGSIVVTAVIVFGLALVFQPLRDWIQRLLDQIFFKSHYDYQEAVQKMSKELALVTRPEDLARVVQEQVQQTLKSRIVQVCFGNTRPYFVPVEEVPAINKGRRLGSICLGEKLSGDDYSSDDIMLVMTLAGQAAIAFENLQLYRRLVRSESLAALGTMSAGMAHEIKNPLASIKGMTQVLPENLDDKEFIKDYTELVPRQLDRINKIVENLLKVGRRPKLQKTEVDLNDILKEVLDLHDNFCKKQSIEVLRNFTDLPKVKVDPEQLQQVFTNIILNSIQAMDKSGKLEIASQKVSDQVLITVSDTGVGIPADKLDNIFDPFFTLKEKGTGLGLFTAFRIIQEHNGSIEVESRPGKGTTFKIWLSTKNKR